MLSVVIPYKKSRVAHRETIFAWTMKRYSMLLPEAQVVLGIDNSRKKYFNRSLAINRGVEKSDGDYILIADADAIFFPQAIRKGIHRLENTPDIGWVLPYGDYWMLDKVSTQKILSMDPSIDPRELGNPEATFPESTSSLALISKESFIESGGFDERFIAWGPEDQCWALAVSTICGPAHRLPQWNMMHLWHPITPGTRTDNPHYAQMLRLWNNYKRAQFNPNMMKALTREPGCRYRSPA